MTDLPRRRPGSRGLVLDVIRAAGSISRAGLVPATGLTGATISTVVRTLLDEGLVVETGRAGPTGGKPRMLLALDPLARYAVGVQLDRAGITYALVDLAGHVVAQLTRPGVGVADPPVVVQRIAREVHALLAGIDPARVLGLGLVSPGPLTPEGGMVLTPEPMRRWEDFPLEQAVAHAVGLPVLADNDATAAALGEYWSGAAGQASTFAAVYMGTGIGAGLVLDGAPYRGTSGNAGEIGHVCLDVHGPVCWCGARGCTEVLAGPAAVVARARADHRLARDAGLDRHAAVPTAGADRDAMVDRAGVVADFAAVARCALDGDAAAQQIVAESARYLAVATRTLADIVDLELVVLTGPCLAVAGTLYLPVVQAELDRSCFARRAHGVDVRLSASAGTAAAAGAAAAVLQSELAPRDRPSRPPSALAAREGGA